MKKLIIAISSFLVIATSAMSMGLPKVGISGSYAAYSATGTEENYSNAGVLDQTSITRGAFTATYASVFIEMDFNDVISLGIDYVPTEIDTPQNVSNEGRDENKVKASFSDLTTIYAKINVPLGGAYLKVGMSQVDVESIETMSSGNTYGNDSTTGMTVGLGYNHEVSNGISIRAEVTASEFDDVTANNGVASTGNRNVIKVSDMIGGRGSISIVKAF